MHVVINKKDIESLYVVIVASVWIYAISVQKVYCFNVMICQYTSLSILL